MRKVNPRDISLTPNGQVRVASGVWLADMRNGESGPESLNEGCNNMGNCNGSQNSGCTNDSNCARAMNYVNCVTHPV